jgi:hypothetical protein
MKEIKEKRELQIENKIFTKNDLISLIRLFIAQSIVILDKSKGIKRQNLIRDGWQEKNGTEQHLDTSHSGIEFTSADKLKYSFSFNEISEATKILDTEQIVEVELYFRENVLNSKFVIKLRQSGVFSGTSYVLVEGEDSDWINGTIKLSENFLVNCRDQSTFIEKNKILIFGVTILLLIIFLHNIIVFFIRTRVIFPKIVGNMFSESIIYVILVLILISATPTVLIYRWLNRLFPGIEIRTGVNFEKAKKERRNKLLLLAVLIIIPTILSFLLL